MITNERQYKITKSKAEEFAESVRSFDKNSEDFSDVHSSLVEAQLSAMRAQLEDLNQQIREYEEIKSGKFSCNAADTLKELPIVLIKARIAKGLTQAEMAKQLGLKEQQIQRYESQKYKSASLERLKEIADILSVKLSGQASLESEEQAECWDKFPIKEMYKRQWFSDFFRGTIKDLANNTEEIVSSFLKEANLLNASNCLHRKNVRSGSQLNEYALKAWHARVVIKAKKQNLNATFKKSYIHEEWLQGLASLSAKNEGPTLVRDYLSDAGISFVVEPHLKGTHLDGAALLASSNRPVVALTLRHDRLDNFWFVLFHEIAHVKLHLSSEGNTQFFDELDDEATNEIETEADKYALNAQIAEEKWKRSLARFVCTEEAILKEATKLNIHPAIIAGRLRRETGDYTRFTKLIGSGEVKKHFKEEIDWE